MQLDYVVAVINTALEGRRVPHVIRDASRAVRLRAFTPSEHSPYQPNLLLIMTNVEIAKTESLGVRSPSPIPLFVVGGFAIERIVPSREKAFPANH